MRLRWPSGSAGGARALVLEEDETRAEMKEDIRKFARLGLSHFMLYPKCMEDSDYHVRTLEALVKREDIETFDCFVPYGQVRQKRLVQAIRRSGKENIGFFIHHFPYRKLLLCAAIHSSSTRRD